MQIHLDHVVPEPLKDSLLPGNTWDSEIQISSPEYCLVRARSGKGKTTLIHLIYGMRRDYSGQIRIGGKDLRDFSLGNWALLRRHQLSIVFQDLLLFPGLSMRHNLRLKSELCRGLPWSKIESMADQLGIAGKMDQQCRLMSQGQQQRVAILRALIQPFEMLLLDEPFSHLDAEITRVACKLISERCEELNAGLLMSSLGETYDFEYQQIFEI